MINCTYGDKTATRPKGRYAMEKTQPDQAIARTSDVTTQALRGPLERVRPTLAALA